VENGHSGVIVEAIGCASVAFTIIANALRNATLPRGRPLSDGRNYARTTVALHILFVTVWMAFFSNCCESNRGIRLRYYWCDSSVLRHVSSFGE
jgi:hypothetical protein